MEIQMIPHGAGGRAFIKFEDKGFDELGEVVNRKVGFIEVDPAKAQQVFEAYASGKRKKAFGRFNRQTGVYDMDNIIDGQHVPSSLTPGAELEKENTLVKQV
jgi:hypothetical protein